MGKFCQIFMELSARDTIMVGYYSLMFLFTFLVLSVQVQHKLQWSSFCVACVAWQTHRHHIVRPHRRRQWRHHTFRFCRTLYHYKIQVKFDIGNHPPNFGWVMALFDLVFVVCFHSITSEGMYWFYWKFAEWYIIVKYRSSLLLVIICQILAVVAFFRLSFCWLVDIGFQSVTLLTFEGMHWCHSNFAELYITVKYRSSSILVIIR